MPVTTAVASKSVIVADDTAFVRDRFRSALESAGHQASIVSDAASLLARVREDGSRVDLVVVDLRLPALQGTALVKALRDIAGFTAPIVVFSGTIANADEVRELALLGVAGYINEYSAVQHIVPALSPHLFPDQFNRRTSPLERGTAVKVRFRLPGASRDADTQASIDDFVRAHFFSNRKA